MGSEPAAAQPYQGVCPDCGAPVKLHQDIAAFIREHAPRALAAPAVRGKASGQGGPATSPPGEPMKPEPPSSPTPPTSYAVHTRARQDGAAWMDSGARCRTEAEALAHGRALAEGTDRRWTAVPSTDAPQSPAHLDLRLAAERACAVLDTLYFEYQRKIGPYASQAHDVAAKLRNALGASSLEPARR